MPTADYLTLTGVVYIMLEHPGAFATPEGQRLTQVHLTRLSEDHKELVKSAKQARELENALKRMIIKMVPERYLAILRNPITSVYNSASDFELSEADSGDIGMEVTEVMVDIRFLSRLATTINNPYSDAQLMRLALKIFTNCGYFSQGTRTWKARPMAEHTLDNLRQHFIREHVTLRKLNPQGIGAMVGHQVNVLQEHTDSTLNQQQQFFEAKTQELIELVLVLRQE
mmetsp:Transcript_20494/g.31339  ORF Transcript_20494/g.31339 Transcript_20494/m.31339 type:complete len:227 (-) Transcript_20494:351-1031(-)